MTTLAEIEARPYPAEVLEGCESALLLFCAGFLGAADGIHVARAGIADVIGIDSDAEKLAEMQAIYPYWGFSSADVFEWARSTENPRWDLVSVDPPNDLIPRALDELGLWCSLARRVVTLTVVEPLSPPLDIPEDWALSRLAERNSHSAWLVLEKA